MRVTPSDPALRDSIAYTPAPKFQGGAKKRPRWNRLIIAATVAALAVGGGALMLNRQLNSPSGRATKVQISSTVESRNIVFVSDRELDVEATEAARAALKRGELPNSVANFSEHTRQELLSGERSLYRSPPAVEQESNDAAAVRIFVDDVQFQDVILSKIPAYFAIPLKQGVPTRVTYLVTADRGGKGVAFRVTSTTGELTTRKMAVGEKITQTVALQ